VKNHQETHRDRIYPGSQRRKRPEGKTFVSHRKGTSRCPEDQRSPRRFLPGLHRGSLFGRTGVCRKNFTENDRKHWPESMAQNGGTSWKIIKAHSSAVKNERLFLYAWWSQGSPLPPWQQP